MTLVIGECDDDWPGIMVMVVVVDKDMTDIIFVKRFTRPQFWASKIYAKKAEFAIKQVRDKIM